MGTQLTLRVGWEDGFVEWVSSAELQSRQHCLQKMVKFYESKVRSRR